MSTLSTRWILIAFALSALGAPARAQGAGTVGDSPEAVTEQIDDAFEDAQEAPPAPQAENRPAAPSAAHVWIGGYWGRRNGAWIWVAGRWATPPRHHCRWVPGHWRRMGRRWHWTRGHWGRCRR